MVKRVGLTAIVRVFPSGRETDTLYRSGAIDVSQLKIAPTGRFLSALEGVDETNWTHRLVILDATGNVVRVVDKDVRVYEWCCRSNRIAAITGIYQEAEGFVPTGTYLIDIDANTEERLDIPKAYEVTWADFDQSLYFKVAAPLGTRNIVRYDPQTRRSTLTDYRDLRFSPSGEFYLHYFEDVTLGPPGPHIFERGTGREVRLPDPSLGGIEGWIFDEGAYLRLKRSRYPQRHGMLLGPEVIDGYTVYDVARQVVAARIEDSIRTDVVAPRGVLVLREHGVVKPVRSPGEIPRRFR